MPPAAKPEAKNNDHAGINGLERMMSYVTLPARFCENKRFYFNSVPPVTTASAKIPCRGKSKGTFHGPKLAYAA